jgi:hypothetical protein
VSETKQTYHDPVAGLMRLGEVDSGRDWRDYLALGFTEQHVPELCRMILDEDLFWADSDSDEVWSAVHAWRTLAKLKSEEAIPCLIELLGRVDAYDDDWTAEDLPVVFGHLGQAALKPLEAFLVDTSHGMWSRIGASNSLAKIAERDSTLQDESVAILSRQLANFADQELIFNAILIGNLLDLKAVSAAPIIEQAFAANQVDLMVQGDWEAVQIELGLLAERTTPPPDFRKLMAAQMGIDPAAILDNLKSVAQVESQQQTERPMVQVESQQQAERKAAAQAKAKARAKRKQAKQTRKKQRKRK